MHRLLIAIAIVTGITAGLIPANSWAQGTPPSPKGKALQAPGPCAKAGTGNECSPSVLPPPKTCCEWGTDYQGKKTRCVKWCK